MTEACCTLDVKLRKTVMVLTTSGVARPPALRKTAIKGLGPTKSSGTTRGSIHVTETEYQPPESHMLSMHIHRMTGSFVPALICFMVKGAVYVSANLELASTNC